MSGLDSGWRIRNDPPVRMVTILRKLLEKAESSGFRSMAAKGLLVCPSCGKTPDGIPVVPGGVIGCPSCGARASAAEWSASSVASREAVPDPGILPVGTRITRSSDPYGAVVWNIPASGNSGGMMFFAIFWCGITAVVSGGFLVAFLTGKGFDGEIPGWVLIPFFGLFWAVGLGMFYAGFRSKYARHHISAGTDRVVLRRELFGRITEKSLDAGSVTTVSREVFYQRDYRPVFGIEIRGARGKLRFGSALTEEEKAWLVSDMGHVMLAKEAASGGLATPAPVPARLAYFSIVLPRSRGHLMPSAIGFVVIGVLLAIIGTKVIEDFQTPAGKDGSTGTAVFDLLFGLATGGFDGLWLMGSWTMVLVGLVMLFFHFRSREKETRLEGTELEISIRSYRNGRVLEDRTFPRTSVTDIRCSVSGSSNGKPMKRVELIVGDKAEKLAWWVDGELADAFVAGVRAALG